MEEWKGTLHSGLGSASRYVCDPGHYLTSQGLSYCKWKDNVGPLTSRGLCETPVTSYGKRSLTNGKHPSDAKRSSRKGKFRESPGMLE